VIHFLGKKIGFYVNKNATTHWAHLISKYFEKPTKIPQNKSPNFNLSGEVLELKILKILVLAAKL
jgi:hypothetical protein